MEKEVEKTSQRESGITSSYSPPHKIITYSEAPNQSDKEAKAALLQSISTHYRKEHPDSTTYEAAIMCTIDDEKAFSKLEVCCSLCDYKFSNPANLFPAKPLNIVMKHVVRSHSDSPEAEALEIHNFEMAHFKTEHPGESVRHEVKIDRRGNKAFILDRCEVHKDVQFGEIFIANEGILKLAEWLSGLLINEATAANNKATNSYVS